jgi:hypothetical protein
VHHKLLLSKSGRDAVIHNNEFSEAVKEIFSPEQFPGTSRDFNNARHALRAVSATRPSSNRLG